MFGLPTTTSSGVPLMTMEQIQQLQQLQQRNSQSHHHGGSAAGSMQQHGATNSPGTLLPHGSSQQYVLGHEVSPLTSAQFFQSSSNNSFMMNANCASHGGSNNYEALSDAALWKLFWEETSNNNNHSATPAAAPSSFSMDYSATTTTTPNQAKGGSPTLTSIREHDAPRQASAASQTRHPHHERMGSNVSVGSHVQNMYQTNDEAMKPTSRMNSPSPTPSAMSCSTAESKPNVAHHALARVQSQQAPAAALCPPPTLQTSWPTTCMSDVANSDEDPLNVMLQQFYQQQQQMQQQQIALQQQQALAAPQKVQAFPSAAAHDLVPPAPQYQTKAQSRKAAAAEAAKNSSQDIANATYLIPSIVMPPSVMTSVLTPPQATDVAADDYDAQQRRRRKNTSAANGSKRKNFRQESPQHCLDRILLQMRGYSPGQLRIKADVAQYDITPSPLQLASFGTELVRAIHTSDLGTLSEMLSCGLSPSPCNQFRDSIVDLVCKRANASVFRTLVEHGSDLRVCDGFGRTPLHHCCWASSFSPEIATLILQRDWRQLFLEDKRGQTPLEYVREDLFDEWIAFMQETVEAFVPQHVPNFSPIKLERPEGFLPDPVNAVPPKLAMAVSAGKITPKQVMQMSMETKAKFDD
ncbi:hypothetical protein MPSEU_001078900 [Mayamaea pseudoterrestris]|nr:hypothetical protein MPSEU_001078900 [Mayamaea pseudoterrestris]